MRKIEEQEKSYEFNSFFSNRGDITTRLWWDFFGEYDFKEITGMIKNPMECNEQLRHMARRIYSSNGMVHNTIDYMVSMPTLDYVVTVQKPDKYANGKKNLVKHVLDLIKHKEFIRDAIWKGAVDGTAFYYFDTGKRPLSQRKYLSDSNIDSIKEINEIDPFENINASIVSLPTDYCKIVGRKNGAYIVAFDLRYFSEGTESAESKLKKYPHEIREAYSRKKNGWVVLDSTRTIVHKISSAIDEPWGRSIIAAAIPDILYADYYTNSKRAALENLNNQVVYETFPKGAREGTCALTEEQQKRQHSDVKSGILNKNSRGGISFVSVAAGTEIDTIDLNTDILDDTDTEENLITRIATSLGFAASLLNASGETSFSAQQTNLELVTSQIFQWIEGISTELNKCINEHILGETLTDVRVNYLPITHLNKANMISNAKDLYLQGKGSLTLWASAAGISPDVFFSMLDEEKAADIENKYPVHRTSYTQSADDNSGEVGRPVEENPTNENTIRSKNSNSNNTPRP